MKSWIYFLENETGGLDPTYVMSNGKDHGYCKTAGLVTALAKFGIKNEFLFVMLKIVLYVLD